VTKVKLVKGRSGYNELSHEIANHKLDADADAQAFSGLLGGFPRLPAPAPGEAALSRARQFIRRRLIPLLPVDVPRPVRRLIAHIALQCAWNLRFRKEDAHGY